MIYVAIIFIAFISFFILFTLSRNDFVLIRKNVSLVSIFDKAFLSLLIAFLIGRVIFILDSTKLSMLYSLTFFHVFKYPGISLLGVFLGLFIPVVLFRKKKVVLRTADIFSLSFFFFYPLFIVSRHGTSPTIFIKAVITVVSFIFFALLIFFHRRYTFRDGTISLIIVLLVALDVLFSQGVMHPLLLKFSQWISVLTIIVGFFLLSYNERFRKRS